MWGAALALAGTILLSADQAPTVSITAPQKETVVSGPTPIAVAVSRGAAVKTVSLFVDGRLVCTVGAAAVRVHVGSRDRACGDITSAWWPRSPTGRS